jgi:hypothetical protein
MKKILRGIIIAVLVIATLATLTGCNNYKWDAVGSTSDRGDTVEGNGTLAVKTGDYLYYVNGVADTSSLTKADNKWGDASIKGNIIKSKITANGLEYVGVVVPKLFASDYSDAGIYIYGEWLYYVTRSIKTDNTGALISAVEFMRTKLDGKKTQSIAIVESTSCEFIFTESGLIYAYDSDIHFVSYTDKKVGKDEVKVEEYSGLLVSKENQLMFYTKASKNTLVSANNIGVVLKDGTSKTVISEEAYSTAKTYYSDVENLYTLAMLKYDASENALYYTKTGTSKIEDISTVAYKFDDNFTFNKDNEIKYATSALTSSIYLLGTENGILDISSTTVKIYRKMTGEFEDLSKELTFSAEITPIKIDGNNMYCAMNSYFYFIEGMFKDGDKKELDITAYAWKISDVTFGTTYGNPTMIGDDIYYVSADDSSYQYKVSVKDFDCKTNPADPTKAIGYILSGYKDYTYPDGESKEDYIINKDTSLEGKVPAHMTDTDLSTYVTSHKTEIED